VAHTCNPSYSGGRGQEDHGSKAALHKKERAGGVAQGVGPEFKPQYWKKKKKYQNILEKRVLAFLIKLYTLPTTQNSPTHSYKEKQNLSHKNLYMNVYSCLCSSTDK
jgi:hypothetical protein